MIHDKLEHPSERMCMLCYLSRGVTVAEFGIRLIYGVRTYSFAVPTSV